MQQLDQFRNLFPGRVGMDQFAPKSTAKIPLRSNIHQLQPSSQSQEPKSQPTTQFQSTYTESDNSTGFDELIAANRHSELKESFGTIRRQISHLSNTMAQIQTIDSQSNEKLLVLEHQVAEVLRRQVLQETLLSRIDESLHSLLETVCQTKSTNISVASDPLSEQDEPVSGVSVSEYLKARRMRSQPSQNLRDHILSTATEPRNEIMLQPITSKPMSGSNHETSGSRKRSLTEKGNSFAESGTINKRVAVTPTSKYERAPGRVSNTPDFFFEDSS